MTHWHSFVRSFVHRNPAQTYAVLIISIWYRSWSVHTEFCFKSFFLFSFLGKGLTQLDVSQNQLQNVPSNAIKNLHHLLILNLNHNRISQIHNRAFEGLDTLEILTLYENKINVIESEAFRGLEKWVFFLGFPFLISFSFCSRHFFLFFAGNWNVWTWVEMIWHRYHNELCPFSIISKSWKFKRTKFA